MELMRLLKRQLDRLELSYDALPAHVEKWQKLLEIVNTTYNSQDQDRYLNERSILISSRELTELNKKLQTAQHISRLGYWEYDDKTKSLQLSREIISLFEPVKLKSVTTLEEILKSIHENDQKRFSDALSKALFEKGDYDCEFRLANAEGLHPWFYMIVRSNDLSKRKLSGIMIDITKRKYAEEEIKTLQHQLSERAEQLMKKNTELKTAMSELNNVQKDFIRNKKKEIFGKISAAVVSQINKPLLSVLISANVLDNNIQDISTLFDHCNQLIDELNHTKEYIPSELYKNTIGLITEKNIASKISDLYAATSASKSNLSKIKTIIDNLSIFSGMKFDDVQEVDVNALIETSIKTVLHDFKDVCTIKKELSTLPTITLSVRQLELVFINLLLNAAESISEKGVITVTTSHTDSKIVIEIKDNGRGIEPENLVHIFTPFFITKNVNAATELGLATTYGILQSFGGNITVESKVGQGSTFTIHLPTSKTAGA